MASVKILDHTYTLPAITTTRFRDLQAQVQQRQQLIQDGVRPQPRRFGLIPRPPAPLSDAERFQELEHLVQDYDTIIAELRQSKSAYQAFFGQLAGGVQRALQRKSAELRQLEQERLADEQSAQRQQDEALMRYAREDAETLWQGVRLLGQATLLMLKKIALLQDGLTRLAEDQDLQRQVLTQLIGSLEGHRRAYARRERIKRTMKEIEELAQSALDFEDYMREHLGPLEGLLKHVAQADASLHAAVMEIEDLTRQMLHQGSLPLPGNEVLDERWLTFLTQGALKRERLADALTQLDQQDGSAEVLDVDLATADVGPTSVLAALDNIELLVEMRLAPLALEAAAEEGAAPSSVSIGAGAGTAADLVDRWGITFVRIPAGTFRMGSQEGRDNERPVHEVTISHPFYLGQYPITQAQWTAVMGENPSRFHWDAQRPVERVSWHDVQTFIQHLNNQEGQAVYRLPTEAEWEYTARAGTTTAYSFGDDAAELSGYAWYQENAGGTTHPVGQLLPNPWGLYDMHGNVWEWVQDWYGACTAAPAVDPAGAATGTDWVVRGGGLGSDAGGYRAAGRSSDAPGGRSDGLGFRLLRISP